MFDVLHGTVQGSVLGLLQAVFVSLMFDLEDISSFADDNYTLSLIKNHENMKIFKQYNPNLNLAIAKLTLL